MTWISTEDKLPQEEGKYLIFILTSGAPFVDVAWYNPKAMNWSPPWGLLPESFLKAITHWMPLPGPPIIN